MDKIYDHMARLHQLACFAYQRKYGTVMSYIEENYFQEKIFVEEDYQYVEDFIFRMDVTELSYGTILELAYRALVSEDYRQFLLGLNMIYVKLKGNQRYTYFDRDQILELSIEMSDKYGFEAIRPEPVKEPEQLLEACAVYLPIGFEGMELKEYRLGSSRSFYERYPVIQDNLYEMQYQAAINQGNIYHHIVEIDHLINSENSTRTKHQWILLAKLLSAHYATEKAPWSADLTTSLLRTYFGLKECCEQEEFESILTQLATGMLKITLNKIKNAERPDSKGELINVVHYMMNVYLMIRNSMFLDYIQELISVMDREETREDTLTIKEWLTEQKVKAG